ALSNRPLARPDPDRGSFACAGIRDHTRDAPAADRLRHARTREERLMWQDLHQHIVKKVRDYYHVRHAPRAFLPGQSRVPYAGRFLHTHDLAPASAPALVFWPPPAPRGEPFAHGLAPYAGPRHAVVVNSGSSANLIAFATLTSP